MRKSLQITRKSNKVAQFSQKATLWLQITDKNCYLGATNNKGLSDIWSDTKSCIATLEVHVCGNSLLA